MQRSIDVGRCFVTSARAGRPARPCMRLAGAVALAFFLAGCNGLGTGQFANPFTANPFTGGEKARTSRLLGLSLPAGLELYPSHGFEGGAQDGSSQGLEVLRGYVDPSQAAEYMFTGLKGAGWQLRQSLSRDSHSLQVYEKDNRMAAIVLRPQAAFTIMEIWTGPRLPDGAALQFRHDYSPDKSLPGEEYGPAGGASQGMTETFGPAEREL